MKGKTPRKQRKSTSMQSLREVESAAQRIASKHKRGDKKSGKLWRNALTRQFLKTYGCSNRALKNFNLHVRMTTIGKRSIHLYLQYFGVPMTRVRIFASYICAPGTWTLRILEGTGGCCA